MSREKRGRWNRRPRPGERERNLERQRGTAPEEETNCFCSFEFGAKKKGPRECPPHEINVGDAKEQRQGKCGRVERGKQPLKRWETDRGEEMENKGETIDADREMETGRLTDVREYLDAK